MPNNESSVLYVDYEGHPAPLSYCFLTQRHLSSSVHRYPPATLTEVESTFCRNCFSYDAATSTVHCTRPGCKLCPLCLSTCTVESNEGLLFYACGLCLWNSKESLAKPLQDPEDKLERARALEELHLDFETKRQVQSIETHFLNMTKQWEARIQQNKTSKTTRVKNHGPWSMELLTEALRTKNESNVFRTEKGTSVPRISLDDNPVESSTRSDLSPLAAARQGIHPFQQDVLFPLYIPFTARTSRRCRKELALGRPGILIKPKLNPLEGDSSLRTGHGQWWKKDASAVHMVPHVRVTKAGPGHVLLQVTNPTLGLARIRLAPSDYAGERSWRDPNKKESYLQDVLVDSMSQTRRDLHVHPLLKDAAPTIVVELQSSEDSLIEMGGKARLLPPEVINWKQEVVASTASVEFLAQTPSAAFFDVQLPSFPKLEDEWVAVPLALEIEIGNGSWETSMVTPTNDDDKWVRFDLLVVNKLL